jgi:hypothetical protein
MQGTFAASRHEFPTDISTDSVDTSNTCPAMGSVQKASGPAGCEKSLTHHLLPGDRNASALDIVLADPTGQLRRGAYHGARRAWFSFKRSQANLGAIAQQIGEHPSTFAGRRSRA